MNDTNIHTPIDPPKVSLMDSVKYKLGYYQGKSRVVTTVVGVALMAGVSIFVAYASLSRKNVSLNPDSNIGAANPSCYLELSLKTPSPTPTMSPAPSKSPVPTPNLQCGSTCPSSGNNNCASNLTCFNGVCRNPSCTSSVSCVCATTTPKPTPTSSPVAGICNITITPADHQTVCDQNSKPVAYTVKFNSLPSGNAPYYLITDWYIGAPVAGEPAHHYQTRTTALVVGQTYTLTGTWPGLSAYPDAESVDVSVSFNVIDKNGNLMPESYKCSGDKNFYWTPYVDCQ